MKNIWILNKKKANYVHELGTYKRHRTSGIKIETNENINYKKKYTTMGDLA